jgi:hypothetical protein
MVVGTLRGTRVLGEESYSRGGDVAAVVADTESNARGALARGRSSVGGGYGGPEELG